MWAAFTTASPGNNANFSSADVDIPPQSGGPGHFLPRPGFFRLPVLFRPASHVPFLPYRFFFLPGTVLHFRLPLFLPECILLDL